MEDATGQARGVAGLTPGEPTRGAEAPKGGNTRGTSGPPRVLRLLHLLSSPSRHCFRRRSRLTRAVLAGFFFFFFFYTMIMICKDDYYY